VFGRQIQEYQKRKKTDHDEKDGQSGKTRCPFDQVKDHTAAPVMIDEWMIGMGVGVEIRAGYHVVSDEQLAIFEMAPDITVGYVDRVSQKVSINGKDKKDREQPEKEGSLFG
jgi:hypothetical protein